MRSQQGRLSSHEYNLGGNTSAAIRQAIQLPVGAHPGVIGNIGVHNLNAHHQHHNGLREHNQDVAHKKAEQSVTNREVWCGASLTGLLDTHPRPSHKPIMTQSYIAS